MTTEGALLLDAREGEGETAAKMGHLLLHVAERTALDPPGEGGCAAWVDATHAAEARALALELRLRRAMGVTSPSGYDFEGAFWGAAPEAREPLLLSYLRAHPDGAPGLDALASGYAERCRAQSDGGAGRR